MIIDNITWDEAMTNDMKNILREFYDVPENCVQTDKEYQKELAFEKQQEAEYYANEGKNENNN